MQFEGFCLMTSDVPRLAQFYRELFETTSEGNDEHTTLTIGGLGLAIWKQPLPAGAGAVRRQCYALMFSAPDVDPACARARALGAAILEEPADQPWGVRAFVMADPDGNRVDVFGKG